MELKPAHLQAVPDEHPKGRVRELFSECAEDLIPSVGAVVVRELFDRTGLAVSEKCPEMILGDRIVRVGDLRLFEYSIAMLAEEEIRDVLLELDLRLLRHSPGCD